MQSVTISEELPAPMPDVARSKGSSLVTFAKDFASKSRPTAAEISKFREMFYTLVFKTTQRERQIIAAHLCRTPYLPRQVALYFALEDLIIAKPVLAYSPVLKPRDLQAVATKCGPAHSEIINKRDSTVLKDVTFPQTHPAKLTSEQISLNLKAASKPVGADAPAPVQPLAVKQSTKPKANSASEKLLELANRGGRVSRKPQTPQGLSDTTRGELEKLLLTAARQHDYPYLALLIQNQTGVSAERITGLIENQNAGMLAALLRTMDMPRVAAGQLLLLLHRNVGRNAQLFRVVLDRYDTMDRQACRNAFGLAHKQALKTSASTGQRCGEPEATSPTPIRKMGKTLSEMEAKLLHVKAG